mmetsp:Transcript_20814/g.79808  ORF Transcript_20814/g.79808 Transcript_20814/m.79808 type:complete len:354 (+) Transcript_20814:940-2001(+)
MRNLSEAERRGGRRLSGFVVARTAPHVHPPPPRSRRRFVGRHQRLRPGHAHRAGCRHRDRHPRQGPHPGRHRRAGGRAQPRRGAARRRARRQPGRGAAGPAALVQFPAPVQLRRRRPCARGPAARPLARPGAGACERQAPSHLGRRQPGVQDRQGHQPGGLQHDSAVGRGPHRGAARWRRRAVRFGRDRRRRQHHPGRARQRRRADDRGRRLPHQVRAHRPDPDRRADPVRQPDAGLGPGPGRLPARRGRGPAPQPHQPGRLGQPAAVGSPDARQPRHRQPAQLRARRAGHTPVAGLVQCRGRAAAGRAGLCLRHLAGKAQPRGGLLPLPGRQRQRGRGLPHRLPAPDHRRQP